MMLADRGNYTKNHLSPTTTQRRGLVHGVISKAATCLLLEKWFPLLLQIADISTYHPRFIKSACQICSSLHPSSFFYGLCQTIAVVTLLFLKNTEPKAYNHRQVTDNNPQALCYEGHLVSCLSLVYKCLTLCEAH